MLPATLPLLCLHGDRDESAPLHRMRALQSLHPNCVIRVIPGGGSALERRTVVQRSPDDRIDSLSKTCGSTQNRGSTRAKASQPMPR